MARHGVKGKGFPGAGFRNRVLESRSREGVCGGRWPNVQQEGGRQSCGVSRDRWRKGCSAGLKSQGLILGAFPGQGNFLRQDLPERSQRKSVQQSHGGAHHRTE